MSHYRDTTEDGEGMSRRRKWIVVGSLAVFIGVAFVVLRPCAKNRVLILNGAGYLADVRVSLNGRAVWSGDIEPSEGVEIIDQVGGEGEFLLAGRHRETGRPFAAQSTYVTNFLGWKEVFLVTNKKVVTTSWDEKSPTSSLLRAVLDRVGCLKYDLYDEIKNVLNWR